MRWERLFQDLEDQLDRETDSELQDIARDEERLRIARLALADRLRSLSTSFAKLPTDARVLSLRTGLCELSCRVTRVGRDWMLAEIVSPLAMSGSALIPLAAIESLRVLDAEAVTTSLGNAADVVASTRLTNDIGIAFVLRDLARRRRHVTIVRGDVDVSGTIERVGRDHVDIAIHSRNVSAYSSHSAEVMIVPLAKIELVLLP